jgi:hypothetical protein
MAKLEREAKRAALTASPLFQAMKPGELDEILKLASERVWPRSTAIMDEPSSPF